MRTIAMTATMFALVAPAAPAWSASLDGTVIKTTFFNGQPFTATTVTRAKYTMVFTPDGKATRTPIGKTDDITPGTWKIVKEGFCTSWKGGTTNCYRLVATGDNKWAVMKGATTLGVWTK